MINKNDHRSFVYLIQGKASNVSRYCYLKSDISDVYVLTYDRKLQDIIFDGDYFMPNSTWAEGRNYLLKMVPKNYSYYIFLDDDAVIEAGSFPLFEHFLLKYKPAIGLPLVDDIYSTFRFDPSVSCHVAIAFDPIVQAFRSDVICDQRILPYETCFDALSWWYSCEIHQYSCLNFYSSDVIQFNSFRVRNGEHYIADPDLSPDSSYIATEGVFDHDLVSKYILGQFGSVESVPFTKFASFVGRYVVFAPGGRIVLGSTIVKLRRLAFRSALRGSMRYFASLVTFSIYRLLYGKVFKLPDVPLESTDEV